MSSAAEVEEGAARKVGTERYSAVQPSSDGEHIRPTSDEERSGSDSDVSRNGRCTVSRTHIGLVIVGVAVGILIGFIGGRASSSAVHTEAIGKDPSQLYLFKDNPCKFRSHEERQRKTAIANKISTAMYLTSFTTQIDLINVSRDDGDGWAPWQFAVSGDASDRGAFCDDDDPGVTCRRTLKNPEWVLFPGGVWGLHIDPELELREGEEYEDEELIETRYQITLTNRLSEPTLMHFHGLVPPNNLDGVPWLSATAIAPNHTTFYDFLLYHRGFYWMHSHFSDQAGSGLFAPIVIRDHPKFRKEIGHPKDVIMMIMDGHWRALCAYARHLYPEGCPIGGFDGWDQYTFHVNGRSLQGAKHDPTNETRRGANEVIVEPGRPVRLRVLDAGTMAFYRVTLGNLTGEVLAKDGRRVQRGMHLQDFPLTSAQRIDILIDIPPCGGCFPIIATRVNMGDPTKEEPTNTEQAPTEQGALILKTSPDMDCSLAVPAPFATPGTAKRINFDSWMKMSGRMKAFSPIPEPEREPDVHHIVNLTGQYDWITGEARPGFTMNTHSLHTWPQRVWCHVPDQCMTGDVSSAGAVLGMKFCQGDKLSSNLKCDEYAHNQKVCKGHPSDKYGRCHPPVGPGWVDKSKWDKVQEDDWGKNHVNVSDCKEWHVRPEQYHFNPHALEVCHGDRVWLTYVNGHPSTNVEKLDGHPIHLHGTHQQLVKVNGKTNIGPVQDTWLLVKGTNLTVAFDALNPGEWLLHCHIEHHFVNGMGTTLRYVMNDRCRNKMSAQKAQNWHHTPRVSDDEWPKDWVRLWDKKKPLKDSAFFAGSTGCDQAFGCA